MAEARGPRRPHASVELGMCTPGGGPHGSGDGLCAAFVDAAAVGHAPGAERAAVSVEVAAAAAAPATAARSEHERCGPSAEGVAAAVMQRSCSDGSALTSGMIH